jgi:hypothetical protein
MPCNAMQCNDVEKQNVYQAALQAHKDANLELRPYPIEFFFLKNQIFIRIELVVMIFMIVLNI